MNKKRTGGMTAIAVLNFIFGGIGILLAVFAIIFVASVLSRPDLPPHAVLTGLVVLALSLVQLPLSGSAIVAGVGVLRVAWWGRLWTLGYAMAFIAVTLLHFVFTNIAAGDVPGLEKQTFGGMFAQWIYPAILLFVANTKRWKETFCQDATNPAT